MDFRTELTDQVVKMLEAGMAPWQRGWTSVTITRPYNGIRGNEYHGGNRLWLTMRAMALGYDDPRWMTYKQAQVKGMQVRDGERATTVEYSDFKSVTKGAEQAGPGEDVESSSASLDERRRPRVFYAKVFNAAQIDAPVLDASGDPVFEQVDARGIVITDENRSEAVGALVQRVKMAPLPEVQPVGAEWKNREFTPIERAERILKGSGARIVHGPAHTPQYIPGRDEIYMPDPRAYKSPEQYYDDLGHEIGHWSGHESRLNRDLSGAFGSEKYALEELRAEMASMYLSAEIGLPHNVENHASYVASWITVLKNDKHELFRAAADAERIADFVLDLDPEYRIAREQAIRDRQAELAGGEPTIGAMRAAPAIAAADELPQVTSVLERADFPDAIVGTIAAHDAEGRLLAHIGRGVAVAVDDGACVPRIPALGEKVRLTRVGDHEMVADVRLVGMELSR